MNAQRIRKRMSGHRRRGDLGNLVRTRSSGGSAASLLPVSPVEIRRPLFGGAPRNSDSGVADFTTGWTTAFGPTEYVDVTGYVLTVTPGHFTRTYIEFGVTKFEYVIKARPFRWVLSGVDAQHLYISDMCVAKNCENSEVGPSLSSHLGELFTTAVTLDAPVRSLSSGVTSRTVEHSRVIVDGVDVSGVVASSGIFPHETPLSSAVSISGKTVSVDIWLKVVVTTNGSPLTTDADVVRATDCSYAINGPGIGSLQNAVGIGSYLGSDANKIIRSSDRYRIIFDRQGAGGASSIVLESQAGWTLTNSDGRKVLTHDSSGDTIDFDFGREVPRILCTKAAAGGDSSFQPRCRYVPDGSAAFDRIWKHQETGLVIPVWELSGRALWNKSGTTTFRMEGRLLDEWDQRLFGVYYPPEANRAGVHGPDSPTYQDFPLTITVEKI